MLDINKYLENQKNLAEKRAILVKMPAVDISEKSKKSADIISIKQHQEFERNDHVQKKQSLNYLKNVTQEAGPSKFVQAEETGSDYIPSSDEEDQFNKPSSSKTRTLRRPSLKKVTDDGDKLMYQNRIQKWKNNLRSLKTDGIVVEHDTITADIKYFLDGNDDGDEENELRGGLRMPQYIWKQLYKYQRSGVKWLWELHQLKSGGLLGDDMGLGKTVQLIAFFTGLSKIDFGTWNGLGPSVIVAPATVIYQWVSHFHYWFPGLRVAVLHNSGSHCGQHHKLLREIHDAHGVLLVTYAGIVKYSDDLLNKSWHYIVLDEGHKIRNADTQVSKLVKNFKTPHRILITASPMQNSLQELWSLFDFMSPGLLGTQVAFTEFFANPITQGGYSNASQMQEVTAYEIAKSLKNIITPYMIRRTKAEVQEHIMLPEKNEQVLFCSLSQEQKDLYLGYLLGNTVRSILDKDKRFGEPMRARILVAISTLRKICNHPDLYLCEAYNEDEQPVAEDNFGNWKRSGKMVVVQSLLKIWKKQGHRTLLFSQSRSMLVILEKFLLLNDYKYLKMDGSVNVSHRQNMIKTFNENSEYLVFLATTRVGGLGVNLTGADRVIIYDPDWNPATDAQAKERAWRIGQRRNVTVYRLISAGTIEEKIYQRQIFKHLLGNKVLIDPNQKNPLKTSHLQGLFTLEEPSRDGETETVSIFSHTKVSTSQDDKTSKNVHLNGGVSFSMKKMAAMRKRAQEISRKIARDHAPPPIDHRERYKTERDKLLNPPKEEIPEVNIINDQVSDKPFEEALSELDIIKLHTKTDYIENLIRINLEQTHENEKQNEIVKNEGNNVDVSNECANSSTEHNIVSDIAKNIPSQQKTPKSTNIPEKIDHLKGKKRKHNKKHKKDASFLKKIKKSQEDVSDKRDDDYVLNKLFAKSGVQSALEHDKIVGLSEKEERHKLKEAASRKVKEALKALKISVRNKRIR